MGGFDLYEFREHLIKPALLAIGMLSDSAVNLLLGTCAQESDFGHFILQKKIGFLGGIGAFQMQKATYDYTWDRVVANDSGMRAKIRLYLGYDGKPSAFRMASDIGLAIIMARLYYSTFPDALPKPDDVEGFANYWKTFWNTKEGAGTTEQFIFNYHKYVDKNV